MFWPGESRVSGILSRSECILHRCVREIERKQTDEMREGREGSCAASGRAGGGGRATHEAFGPGGRRVVQRVAAGIDD